jgi:hypothetical protein
MNAGHGDMTIETEDDVPREQQCSWRLLGDIADEIVAELARDWLILNDRPEN